MQERKVIAVEFQDKLVIETSSGQQQLAKYLKLDGFSFVWEGDELHLTPPKSTLTTVVPRHIVKRWVYESEDDGDTANEKRTSGRSKKRSR